MDKFRSKETLYFEVRQMSIVFLGTAFEDFSFLRFI